MTTSTDHPEKPNDSGQMTAAEVETIVQYRHRRLPTGKGYHGQMGRWCRWHEGTAPFHAPGFEYETRTLYLHHTPPPEVVARHEAMRFFEINIKNLEWTEQETRPEEVTYWGAHPFGYYAIERDYFSIIPWELIAGGRVIGHFDKLDDAKAEAQRHYLDRIRSCFVENNQLGNVGDLCTIGMDCEKHGVCYAAAQGQPSRCERSAPLPVARHEAGELVEAIQFLLDRLNEFELDETDAKEMCRQYMGHIEPAISRVQSALSCRAPDPARPAGTNEALETAWHKAHNAWMKANRHGTLAEATEEAVTALREALAAQLSEKDKEIERLTKWNWAMAENVKLAETQLAAAQARAGVFEAALKRLSLPLAFITSRMATTEERARMFFSEYMLAGSTCEEAEERARNRLNKEGGDV